MTTDLVTRTHSTSLTREMHCPVRSLIDYMYLFPGNSCRFSSKALHWMCTHTVHSYPIVCNAVQRVMLPGSFISCTQASNRVRLRFI